MSGFAVSNELGGTKQAIASSYKTLINLFASNAVSLQRLAVFDIIFGVDGTPADNAMTWDVSRSTVDGTGTTVTPNKLDPADGAALCGVGANYTSEPTVTANSGLLPEAVNQRATTRWVAFPGQEMIIPATNANGLVFRCKSAGYTGTAIAAAMFRHN